MDLITSTLTKKNYSSIVILVILFVTGIANAQTKNTIIEVESFNKVIVAPHIQVNFKQGDKESIIIESSTEPIEKLNIEVKNSTLRIYLDGAKIFTKTEKKDYEAQNRKPMYKGTVVKATVIYTGLSELSLRGSENHICEDLIKSDYFEINIYGDANVVFKDIDITNFKACLYGENTLELKQGTTKNQNFIAYGDATIDALAIKNENTKSLTYGDGKININTSKSLKISSYGDSEINYKGNPSIKKGINIGDSSIKKVK